MRHRKMVSLGTTLIPLTPTVPIWVQLQSILQSILVKPSFVIFEFLTSPSRRIRTFNALQILCLSLGSLYSTRQYLELPVTNSSPRPVYMEAATMTYRLRTWSLLEWFV